jgi:tRNA modification GTPase
MEAAESLAGRLPGGRTASLRQFRDPAAGDIIDEGIIIVFPQPRSFTGEDMCEFHVHGGFAVQRAMLDALASIPGLRAAEPGEFTRRAVRNGRMDLIAAEGLSDLIHARTERQRRQALHHSLGKASEMIGQWRRRLIAILGRIEAAVDFVDEAGVAEDALARTATPLKALISDMRDAVVAAKRGAAIREGIRVVLAGPPNAGKSSLLNALARRDAAIVSAIPGTTRDVIEVMIELAGVPVILSDTAGLREGVSDEIESAGMERTRRELAQADMVLWITAADETNYTCQAIDSDPIWIMNKADLVTDRWPGPRYWLSARTGAGMAEFLSGLEALVSEVCRTAEPPVLIRVRHDRSIRACIDDLESALDSVPEQIELAAEKLRGAAHHLGTLTGAIGVEDVLDSIFQEFCIGK